jgi:hypothetical protein
MWVGIVANVGLALPALLGPAEMLAGRQRTLRMRNPGGDLGAVAADCVMMTGRPAAVSVPVRDEDPVLVVTR